MKNLVKTKQASKVEPKPNPAPSLSDGMAAVDEALLLLQDVMFAWEDPDAGELRAGELGRLQTELRRARASLKRAEVVLQYMGLPA